MPAPVVIHLPEVSSALHFQIPDRRLERRNLALQLFSFAFLLTKLFFSGCLCLLDSSLHFFSFNSHLLYERSLISLKRGHLVLKEEHFTAEVVSGPALKQGFLFDQRPQLIVELL